MAGLLLMALCFYPQLVALLLQAVYRLLELFDLLLLLAEGLVENL